MPRSARLDAPGTVQHVMIRGIEKREIFRDRADRHDLVARLCKILPDSGADCFAWAFLGNHVHLVLRSGPVGLSRVMARINTGYARRFNVRHERVGYLFQNRFRSRLVSDDGDLKNLVRYVHRNPIDAGIVSSLKDLAVYDWCGHGALTGRRAPFAFESVEVVLSLFGSGIETARAALAEFMGEDTASIAPAVRPGPIPEREPVIAREPASVPESLDAIIERFAHRFRVSDIQLRSGSRSPALSRARAAVAYVAVVENRMRGTEVAPALGVSPSGISRALERGRRIVAGACLPPEPVRLEP